MYRVATPSVFSELGSRRFFPVAEAPGLTVPRFPLGANVSKEGVTFRVTSANAESMTLVLFNKQDKERVTLAMSKGPHGVWEITVPKLKEGQHYAFRINNSPQNILDPYSLAISRQMRSYDVTNQHVTSVVVDNSKLAASRVSPPPFDIAEARIMECDVRRLTMGHPDIPEDQRGTFKALSHPVMIQWFKRIGFNAIELLPINACKSPEDLVQRGSINAWGYGTLAGLAPDPFLCYEKNPAKQAKEVQDTIRALADAGVSVILDLSLTHTAGGDFTALDSRYHRRNTEGFHMNETGCGNTFNTDFAPARAYLLDVLRLWKSYGVQGIRFDLAPLLADVDGYGQFNPARSIYAEMERDPDLRDLLVFAEPWSPFRFHLGQFQEDIGEWNNKYRDTVRKFWRGEKGLVGEFATRLFGSKDIFPSNLRTVNFTTVHDGQTLWDNCTYQGKYNLENGHNNTDGADENYSWNCGTEGVTADERTNALRRRRARSMHATDVLASGALLIPATDVKLHTHGGNNNPYCGDKEKFFVPWKNKDFRHQHEEFIRKLMQLRKHEPLMNAPRYVRWLDQQGSQMNDGSWKNFDNRFLGVVFESLGPRKKQTQVPALYVGFNGALEESEIRLPELPKDGNYQWKRIFDTGFDEPFGPYLTMQANDAYKVLGNSVVVFKAVLNQPVSNTLH